MWLPTVHSSVDFGHFPIGRRWKALGPIPVTDDAGTPPAVHEIFDLVKERDAVLATGHIPPMSTTCRPSFALVYLVNHIGTYSVNHNSNSTRYSGSI